MAGVWIAVRTGERVHHPVKTPVFADNNVRVWIVGKKRRQGFHASANVAAHKQKAVIIYIVTEGKFIQVTSGNGNQDTPYKSIQRDACVCRVGGEAVALALRIVE